MSRIGESVGSVVLGPVAKMLSSRLSYRGRHCPHDIDFQRACQAYLWALPLMAMQQWQIGRAHV